MSYEAARMPPPPPAMYLVPENVLRGVIEYLRHRPYAEVAEAMPALAACQKYDPPGDVVPDLGR